MRLDITIITVVYNDANFIETTIKSVLNQKLQKIEYLIIDGGSKDNTVDIIRNYDEFIDFWISEPDSGIYDAMNKGISYARGEWILFLNSGDILVEDVISKILSQLNCNYDIIYGDVLIKKNRQTIFRKAQPLNTIYYSLPFCHQSVFVKSSILKYFLFNKEFKICSDYEFFLKCFKNDLKFSYFSYPISLYRHGGTSNNKIRYIVEMSKIIWKYNNGSRRIYYIYRLLKSFIPINKNIFSKSGNSEIELQNKNSLVL